MERSRNERGQTTVWLVAVAVVVAVCSVALVKAAGVSVDAGRARSAADLVALAAAQGDDAAADEVAESNGVELVSIRWIDEDTVVVAVIAAGGRMHTATAETRAEVGQ